jgi:hypothetical protein
VSLTTEGKLQLSSRFLALGLEKAAIWLVIKHGH